MPGPGVATIADRDRINRTALAWQLGLAEARARGFGDAVRGEGKLLVMGGGLARPCPDPRDPTAAVLSRWAARQAWPAFEKFKPFFCYVDIEGDLFHHREADRKRRPRRSAVGGPDPNQAHFPGSLALGNEEKRALMATTRAERAGIFERIAPSSGAWSSSPGRHQLQVFELTRGRAAES
jgi:hypothetical protein